MKMTRLALKQGIMGLTNSETAWSCVVDYLEGKFSHDDLVCVLKGVYYAAMVKKIIALVEIYQSMQEEGK